MDANGMRNGPDPFFGAPTDGALGHKPPRPPRTLDMPSKPPRRKGGTTLQIAIKVHASPLTPTEAPGCVPGMSPQGRQDRVSPGDSGPGFRDLKARLGAPRLSAEQRIVSGEMTAKMTAEMVGSQSGSGFVSSALAASAGISHAPSGIPPSPRSPDSASAGQGSGDPMDPDVSDGISDGDVAEILAAMAESAPAADAMDVEPVAQGMGLATASLAPDQRAAIVACLSGRNIFLTGEAGTGKTFCIQRFIEEYVKNNDGEILRLAYTGLVAASLQGRTFHSFLGMDRIPDDELKQTFETVFERYPWWDKEDPTMNPFRAIPDASTPAMTRVYPPLCVIADRDFAAVQGPRPMQRVPASAFVASKAPERNPQLETYYNKRRETVKKYAERRDAAVVEAVRNNAETRDLFGKTTSHFLFLLQEIHGVGVIVIDEISFVSANLFATFDLTMRILKAIEWYLIDYKSGPKYRQERDAWAREISMALSRARAKGKSVPRKMTGLPTTPYQLSFSSLGVTLPPGFLAGMQAILRKPFGGLQVIAVGDFFQLPPVNGGPVFLSNVWQESFETHSLTTVFRQDRVADAGFLDVLHALRNNVFFPVSSDAGYMNDRRLVGRDRDAMARVHAFEAERVLGREAVLAFFNERVVATNRHIGALQQQRGARRLSIRPMRVATAPFAAPGEPFVAGETPFVAGETPEGLPGVLAPSGTDGREVRGARAEMDDEMGDYYVDPQDEPNDEWDEEMDDALEDDSHEKTRAEWTPYGADADSLRDAFRRDFDAMMMALSDENRFYFDKVSIAAVRRQVYARNRESQALLSGATGTVGALLYASPIPRTRRSDDDTDVPEDHTIPFSRMTRVLCTTNMTLLPEQISLVNGMAGFVLETVRTSASSAVHIPDARVARALFEALSMGAGNGLTELLAVWHAFATQPPDKRLVPLVFFDTGDIVAVPYILETDAFVDRQGGLHVTSARIVPGVVHGWALTIHKSQGSTLDSAILCIDRSFTQSQIYVGLSRVRSGNRVWIQGGLPRAGAVGWQILPEVTCWEAERRELEWRHGREPPHPNA